MTYIKSRKGETKPIAENFFLGTGYPLFVGVLTLVGYVTGAEMYLNAVNMLLLSLGVLITRSALPLIPAFSMYIFQISTVNSPEEHVGSLYYHSPVVIGVMIGGILLVLITLVYIIAQKGGFSKQNLLSLPLLTPSFLLASAFLTNGAFCPEQSFADVLYGAIIAAEYFLIFYAFFIGLRGESAERLIDYTVFSAAVMALLLSAETLHLYLTREGLFKGGEIVKEQILYGWGMWTMAGQHLAVTIPLCFLGVMRRYKTAFCLTAATLAMISTVMTLSRNALLVGGAAFVLCIGAACFIGKSKRLLRRILPFGIGTLLLILIAFGGRIFTLLQDYLRRGLSDNGRFELWAHGIESFLTYPLFGKGFFGIQRELSHGCAEGFSFYPRMMHNTVVQLLGSMGITGLFAYGYYRYKTLFAFIRRPTLEKTMLGATLLVMIAASMIDNFLFLPKHLIFYSIVLAVAFALDSGDFANKPNLKYLKGNEQNDISQ